MRRRLRLTLVALVVVLLVVVSLGLAAVILASLPLTVLWVGVPLLIGATWLGRRLFDAHRYGAGLVLGRRVPGPYRTSEEHRGFFAVVRAVLTDEATWRDLLWVAVNSTAGLALCLVPVALLLGAVAAVLLPLAGLFPVDLAPWWTLLGIGSAAGAGLFVAWWFTVGPLVRAWASITAALLGPSRNARLRSRVAQLTSSRADSVDSAAQEIRRIERDLHDGVQVRLVGLGMTVGLAEELVDSRPERARRLLAEAQDSVAATLQELRRLVHGIHPPVLADRGLVGAVRALALELPLDLAVHTRGFGEDEEVRLPAPVEACAYFVISEALANVAKHSGALRGAAELVLVPGLLRATVRDEGQGGIDAGAVGADGGGVAGMRRRLAAFDGTLAVSSPPGGPTVVTMEMPCEPLSPKTTPSSVLD